VLEQPACRKLRQMPTVDTAKRRPRPLGTSLALGFRDLTNDASHRPRDPLAPDKNIWRQS